MAPTRSKNHDRFFGGVPEILLYGLGSQDGKQAHAGKKCRVPCTSILRRRQEFAAYGPVLVVLEKTIRAVYAVSKQNKWTRLMFVFDAQTTTDVMDL